MRGHNVGVIFQANIGIILGANNDIVMAKYYCPALGQNFILILKLSGKSKHPNINFKNWALFG